MKQNTVITIKAVAFLIKKPKSYCYRNLRNIMLPGTPKLVYREDAIKWAKEKTSRKSCFSGRDLLS